MALAFMGQDGSGCAGGQGDFYPARLLVAAITTVNFFAIAYALWRKPDKRELREEDRQKEYRASRAVLVSFAAIFFSEWGDVGQITLPIWRRNSAPR